jgi:hypothetical protein
LERTKFSGRFLANQSLVDALETLMKFRDFFRRKHGVSRLPVQVYDPRRGAPFRFGPLPNGNFVSFEQHVVLYVQPEFDILNNRNSRLLSTVLNCLEIRVGQGFALASAAPKAVDDQIERLRQSCRIEDSIFGYFDATPNGFAEHRQLFLSLSYGALLLGNTESALNVPRTDDQFREWRRLRNEFRIEVFAALHLERIRWSLSLDTDNSESVVIARLDSGADALRQELGV